LDVDGVLHEDDMMKMRMFQKAHSWSELTNRGGNSNRNPVPLSLMEDALDRFSPVSTSSANLMVLLSEQRKETGGQNEKPAYDPAKCLSARGLKRTRKNYTKINTKDPS